MVDAPRNSFEPDDPLDQLLHRSSGSDVDSDRVDRLQEHWQGITRRRARVQAGLTMMVCIVIGVSSLLAIRPNLFDSPIAKPDSLPKRPQVRERAVARDDAAPTGDRGVESVAGDAIFEQLVCVALEREIRQRKRDKQAPPKPRETIDDVVAMAVKRIGQQEDCEDLVKRIQNEWSEDELLTWIGAAKDAESVQAALHLLSHLATSRSVPVLMRLRSNSLHHETSTALIARVGDQHLLFRLATEENDKSLRQDLAAALLRRSNPESLLLFLKLVDNRRTSATALAAVAKVETLPCDLLLQCLSARSRKVRLTAAMVLGQCKDPQVSAQLVQLLRPSQTRRAAMVALVASDSESARRFVDQASRDLYLAASVHAAQTVVNSFRLES